MANKKLIACIMAGGSGTRFWPVSTKQTPKQFLNLFGQRSLLQQSFDRLDGLIEADRILVLTNNNFANLVKKQLPEIPQENIICEPLCKDTAPAITLAALICEKRFGSDSVMLIFPSDHIIEPVELFQENIQKSAHHATQKEVLCTFGIQPDYPATCYGYLEIGNKIEDDHHTLLSFKEKPSLEIAKSYLSTKKYFWNSGMFVWQIRTIIKEIQKSLPEHYKILSKVVKSMESPDWNQILYESFKYLSPISIDYGVMEKVEQGKIHCLITHFSWNDLGTWTSLTDYLEKDKNNNVIRGSYESLEANDNIIFCDDDKEKIFLVGVKDLIVVKNNNKTLVMHKDYSGRVKELVKKIDT